MALPIEVTNSVVSAHPADGTITNGNTRGSGAVDLQTTRAAATNVASGTQSVVGGGQSNTASGSWAVCVGGQGNSATGSLAFCGGGVGNAVSGTSTWVPGGDRANTRGLIGRGSWASGQFAASGDAQSGEMVLRGATADATPLVLTSDAGAASATNQLIIPNNSVAAVRVTIAARETATGAGKAMWDGICMVRRDASAAATNISVSASLSAAAPTLAAGVTTGWVVSALADTTNGGLNVQVTGAAATSIHWVARVSLVEGI